MSVRVSGYEKINDDGEKVFSVRWADPHEGDCPDEIKIADNCGNEAWIDPKHLRDLIEALDKLAKDDALTKNDR